MGTRGLRKRSKSPAKSERERLLRTLAAVDSGELRRGFSQSRDAMAAMVVVRAIARARELAEAQSSDPQLRRVLKRAERLFEDYIRSRARSPQRRRVRRKA